MQIITRYDVTLVMSLSGLWYHVSLIMDYSWQVQWPALADFSLQIGQLVAAWFVEGH
jgi:hypothetical protein